MNKEIKVILTIVLGFFALLILMSACTPQRGYYDSYGHYHPGYHRSSSFFFWGGGAPVYSSSNYNYNSRNYSNRAGSVNNSRYYSGSYRRGK